jgi:hypothetical protein
MTGADVFVRRAVACTTIACRCFGPGTPPTELIEAIAALWKHAAAAQKESAATLEGARKLASFRRRGAALSLEIKRRIRECKAGGNDTAARELEHQLARYRQAFGEDVAAMKQRIQERLLMLTDNVQPFEDAVGVVLKCLEGTAEHDELLAELR